MPIVPSRSGRIHELVASLSSPRAAERDRAVARLTLIGARAVGPLLASLPGAPAPARLASIEVLEEVQDPRTLRALEDLAGDPDAAVAARAAEALGGRGEARSVTALARVLARPRVALRRAALGALASLHRRGVVEALAPLLDTLLDEEADPRLRVEIVDLLPSLAPPLGRATRQKLARRLASSRAEAVAARAATLTEGAPRRAADAAAAPEAVSALARRLGRKGDAASIPVLSRTLERLAAGPGPGDDAALEARVAVHEALADLDSRIALHDLRDLVGLHPRRVMPRVLEVVARVGDPSLAPALARAASEDPSLLEPCARALSAIARRHRLRKTSPALRRVRREHQATLERLLAGTRRR